MGSPLITCLILCPHLLAKETQTMYNLYVIVLISSLTPFFPSTIRAWNDLPQYIKDANTVTAFKYCLSRHRSLPPKYYNSGSRIGQILHARWRIGYSSLSSPLYLKILFHLLHVVNLKAVIIFFSTVLDIQTSGILTFLTICTRILFRNCFTVK